MDSPGSLSSPVKDAKVHRTHQQHDPAEQCKQVIAVGQVGHRNKLQKAFQLAEVAKHLRTVEIRPIEAVDRVNRTLESVPHERHVQQRAHQHTGITQRHKEPGKQRRRHHYQDAHEDGVLHRYDAAEQQPEHLRDPPKHEANERERPDAKPLERLGASLSLTIIGRIVPNRALESEGRKSCHHLTGRSAVDATTLGQHVQIVDQEQLLRVWLMDDAGDNATPRGKLLNVGQYLIGGNRIKPAGWFVQ
uniref:Uncharacterized protein n=1 Tax=Anopheles farauti TaxID=69004 RepID=A0A182QUF3_9DIPT